MASFDEQRIDAIFQSLRSADRPGAAVGIAMHGRLAYRKGFGLANVATRAPFGPGTPVRIASLSKQVTCLAFLLLCEAGRAEADDPIGKYFPELHPIARRITMRQLMGHTSGLRDVVDLWYQFASTSQGVARAELLPLYHVIDDVNFAPGAAWNYNNGGYLLLSKAIERIADSPLEDVLRRWVFEPIGMSATSLCRWDRDLPANAAVLYTGSPDAGFTMATQRLELDGGGGIVSTIDDWLKWLAHLASPVVGNAATWAMMRSPQRLTSGASSSYGAGLMVERYRGVEWLGHAAGLAGCTAHALHIPSARLDIVGITNRDDVSATALAYEIVDACLENLDRKVDPPLQATEPDVQSSGGGEEAESIARSYVAEPIQTRAQIFATQGSLRLRTLMPFGSAEYRLQRIGAATWRAHPVASLSSGGVIEFDSGGDFRFTSARNVGLRFRRLA